MAKADKVSIVWSGRLGNVPLVECRRVGYRYRYRNLFISGERKPDVTGDAIFGIIDS